MSVSTCTVTGNVKNLLGNNVADCTVKVSVIAPFIYGSSLIAGELASVTTGSSGDFSITLLETTSVGQRVTFTFDYYDGVSNRKLKSYPVVIPDQTSAVFTDLVAVAAAPTIALTFPAQGVTVSAISGLTATNAQTAFAEQEAKIDGHIADTANPHAVTATQVGLGNVDNTSDATKNSAVATLTNKTLTAPVINSPTGLAKADVGLGNVDNTSDATKDAATTTLTNKTLTSPVINSPTGIVKADVGLGNVDNTSDATKNAASVTLTNKTIDAASNTLSNIANANISSTAAIAVSKLAALSTSIVPITDGSGKLSSSAVTATTLGYLDATSSVQTQLNAKQATGNYVTALTGDVTASGPGSVAATIAANAVTNAKAAQMAAHTFKGNNTGSTANALDLTVAQLTAELNAVVGDSGSGGTKGLVPAPASGDAAAAKFLKADGTWAAPASATVVASSNELVNLGLAASVATNILTVNLKQSDGSTAPSTGSSAVKISFRDSTLANGQFFERSVTGSLSVTTVATGATLGLISAQNQYIYVYAIDNAGTVELALAGNRAFDEGTRYSTTAIGAGSTDGLTLYSTTARSNVAIRLIGRLKSNQTTSGTYASAPTEIAVMPLAVNTVPRSVVRVRATNGYGSTNTVIRRYSSTDENIGTAITYADSASLGGTFTINEDGIYAVSVIDLASTATNFGISRNSTQLTTSVTSITATDLLVMAETTASDAAWPLAWTGYLRAGDVLRCHTRGVSDSSVAARGRFIIAKVSN